MSLSLLPRYICLERDRPAQRAYQGQLPLDALEQLTGRGQLARGVLTVQLHWSQEAQPLLCGSIKGVLQWCCERCLRTMDMPLEHTIEHLVVANEQQAKEGLTHTENVWDLSSVSQSQEPLWSLVEEEIMLHLPMFLKHEPECPQEIA